jgi:hypothetical protein
MSVIERVMKAYASKYDLTQEQAAKVRLELSNFINELTSIKRCEPTMLPEMENAAAALRHQPSDTITGRSAKAD